MGFAPQMPSDRQRIDPVAFPPALLMARGMILGVMDGAEWHGKLIADLEGYASRLRIANMMRV